MNMAAKRQEKIVIEEKAKERINKAIIDKSYGISNLEYARR